MKPLSHRLLICTPLFWVDASGASIYYRLLTSGLAKNGVDVSVISDKEEPGEKGSIRYFSLFPRRCGRETRRVRDMVAYLFQNMSYFRLPGLVHELSPNTILIHSSFYNFPGIFGRVVNSIMQENAAVQFIADVRDSLMPKHKVPLLNGYRRVIACSRNVETFLLRNGLNSNLLVQVPVIQERLSPDERHCDDLLRKLGLDSTPYLFYGGLIKESKGVDILLEAFLRFVRPARRDLRFVVAGLIKTAGPRVRRMLMQEGVVYVGNRPRGDVLSLMSRAALCMNISPNEGLPRASLEALALRRPAMLPPNVPEFLAYSKDFVVSERDPREVAKKMVEMADAGLIANYPIERHAPENVLRTYTELLVS